MYLIFKWAYIFRLCAALGNPTLQVTFDLILREGTRMTTAPEQSQKLYQVSTILQHRLIDDLLLGDTKGVTLYIFTEEN